MRRRFAHSSRRVRLVRWLVLAVVVAIAIAYVQPIRAYMDAREDVAERKAELAALKRKQAELRRRLELAQTDEFLLREARLSLGLVRPGERLFIVTGLPKDEETHLP